MEKDEAGQQRELRKRAEARLKTHPEDIPHMSPDEVCKLVHELQTHQIELEVQNEDLRRTQEGLLESRRRYASLYDWAPVTLNKEGLILETNLTFANMVRVDRKSLLNQPFSMFILDEDQDIFYLHRRNYLKTNEQLNCEFRMRRKEGELFWARLESVVLDDEDGDGFQIRSAISDITRQKHLEERLRQAHKMEAVGQLAAGVAHNVNNLLMGIIGNLCFAKTSAPEKITKFLTEAEKAAQRVAKLVQHILAFSRKLMITLSVMNLNRVVNEAVTLAREMIDRDIEIEVQTDESLPSIQADFTQMNLLLMAMLMNAWDAIEKVKDHPVGTGRPDARFIICVQTGCRTIGREFCESHADARPGQYVVLSVSDNGAGMDTGIQPHVFEPFFTTKGLAEGTGMNLASAYGAVQQHHGWIDFDSELGQGTTFHVYLPVAEAEK
ncbi:MAG: ATP-binding protein [bacterium]